MPSRVAGCDLQGGPEATLRLGHMGEGSNEEAAVVAILGLHDNTARGTAKTPFEFIQACPDMDRVVERVVRFFFNQSFSVCLGSVTEDGDAVVLWLALLVICPVVSAQGRAWDSRGRTVTKLNLSKKLELSYLSASTHRGGAAAATSHGVMSRARMARREVGAMAGGRQGDSQRLAGGRAKVAA